MLHAAESDDWRQQEQHGSQHCETGTVLPYSAPFGLLQEFEGGLTCRGHRFEAEGDGSLRYQLSDGCQEKQEHGEPQQAL